MTEQVNNSKILSLKQASELSGYDQDYLGQLCRSGKLRSTKVGKGWVTSESALNEFLGVQNLNNILPDVPSQPVEAAPVEELPVSAPTTQKIPVRVIAPVNNANELFEKAESETVVPEPVIQTPVPITTLPVETPEPTPVIPEAVQTPVVPEALGATAVVAGSVVGATQGLAKAVSKPSMLPKVFSLFMVLVALVSGTALLALNPEFQKSFAGKNKVVQAPIAPPTFIEDTQSGSDININQPKSETDLPPATTLPASTTPVVINNYYQPSAQSLASLEESISKIVFQLFDSKQLPLIQGETGPIGPEGPKGDRGPISVTNINLPTSYDQLIITALTGDDATFTDDVTIGDDLIVSGTITAAGISGTIDPSFTLGSVAFQGATGLDEDNANFFWDDASDYLGLGTNTPSYVIDVQGSDPIISVESTSTNGDAVIRMESHRLGVGNEWTFGPGVGASHQAFAFLTTTGAITAMSLSQTGQLSLGTESPSAKLHVLSTTEQLRLGYDTTNYTSLTTSSTGVTTFSFNGSAPQAIFIPQVDSGSAFDFQDSAGDSLFRIDTSGRIVNVGENDGSAKFNIDATITSATGFIYGQNITVNADNSLFGGVNALNIDLGGAFAGSSSTNGIRSFNTLNSTATQLFTNQVGNSGVAGFVSNSATGHNAGILGIAGGSSSLNAGIFGNATTSANSEVLNIGVVGKALNATNNVGGYFYLGSTTPSGFTSTALLANNGSQSAPIFIAQDNASQVFIIADGGNVGIGSDSSPVAGLTVGDDTGATVASGAGDAYIQNDLEVDGTLTVAGATTYSGALSVITTTSPQLTVGYDSSNKFTTAVASDGGTTWAMLGSDADLNINFAGATDGDFSINTDDLFVDTSNGRVGIGTAVPSYGLHVQNDLGLGISRSTGRFWQIVPDATDQSTLRILTNGNSNALVLSASSDSYSKIYSESPIMSISGANAGSLYLNVGEPGSGGSVILGKRVGDDLILPTKYEFYAAGAKTANYSGVLFNNTATSSTGSVNKYGLEIQNTGTWDGSSANNVGLYVSSVTGGTNNYDAIFNGGGNVGIGTMTPAAKLEVTNNADSSTLLQITNTTAGTSAQAAIQVTSNAGYVGFYKYSTTRTTYKTAVASDAILYNSAGGNITILNDNASGNINFTAGGASTPHLVVASTGNVGIGTSAPLSGKLDIRGPLGTASWKTLPTDGTGGFNYGLAFVQDDSTASGTTGYFRMVNTDGTLVSGRNILGLQIAGGGDRLLVPGNTGLVDMSADNKIRFCGPSGSCITASELQVNKIRLSPSFATADALTDPGDGGVHFPGNSYFATSTGSVGVATATPRSKLEVYGDLRYGGSSPISATTVSDNPLTLGATTVNVSSTTGYPTSGTLVIDSESMTYTGISGNAFTGVTRGVLGTTAVSHVSGSRIDYYLSIAQRNDTTPKFTLTSAGRAAFGRATASTSYSGGLYPTVEIGALDNTFPQAVSGSAYLSLNSGAGAIPGLVFARDSVQQWVIVDRHDDPGRLSFMNATSGQIFNFLQNGSFGINDTSPDANLEVVNDGSGDSFLVADSADGDTTPFVIQGDGDVGVGMTTPGAKLEVASEQLFTYPTMGLGKGTIHISPVAATNDDTTAITFGANSGGTLINSAQAGIYVQSSVTYGTKMYFGTTDVYATGSQARMMIDQLGNVGIGTVSPQNKLDIEGGAVIGATYSGTNTAPTNGLLVEGNVGIGTISPVGKFSVTSGVSAASMTLGSTTGISQSLNLDGTGWGMYFGLDTATGNGWIQQGRTSASTAYNLLLQASGGNVGIGTVSPSYKLQVDTPTPGSDTYSIVSKDLTVNRQVGFYWKSGGLEGGVKGDSQFNITAGGTIFINPGGSTTITAGATTTGIGAVNTPVNTLDIFGGVAIGSYASGYGGVAAAPTNGLIVAGNVGIGTISPDAKLEIAGNVTAAAWGLNGIQLQGTAATYTDSSTAASGTATNAVFTSFGQPTLAASNLTVTTTNAATVYIAAAPAAGTNQTITNAYALWVDAGTARFDGDVTVAGTLTGSGSGTFGYFSRSGTTITPATSGDSLSFPGSAGQSQQFGLGATAGLDSLAVGHFAVAGGTSASTAIGTSASAGTSAVAVGQGATASNFVDTAIGAATSATFGYGIALGYGATTTTTNQFVAGSNTAGISNVYIGNGVTNAAPGGFVLQGSGGSGADVAGASVTIAGGKGTGNAVGGDILFQTSDAGASGATLQSLTTKMTLTELGNLGIGTTAPAGKLNVSAAPTATANYGLVSLGAGPWDGSTSGYFTGSGSGTVLAINTPSFDGTNLRIQEAGVDILLVQGTTAGAATMFLGSGFAGPVIHAMSSDAWGMAYKQTGIGTFSVGQTGASNSSVLYYDGANQWTFLAPTDNASYTKVLTINAKTTLTTAGAKLLSLQNNGSENAFVDKDGGGYFAGATGINDTSPDASFEVVNDNSGDSFLVADNADGDSTPFVIQSDGDVGIGVTAPAYKLDVETNTSSTYAAYFFNDGNDADRYGIQIQGGADDASGTTYYLRALDGDGGEVGYIANTSGTFALTDSSDIRTKTNISNTVEEGLATIMQLRVVDFNRLADPDGPRITGFIAQEVNEVYPKIVNESSNGFLGISKENLIPILVKAMQEQQDVIASLQQALNSLQGNPGGNISATKLSVKGHLYFNEDVVGQAKILSGSNKVRVSFKEQYEAQPIVTITPMDFVTMPYKVTNVDAGGFTIELFVDADTDITFSWHSFGGDGAKLSVSDGSKSDIELIAPVPVVLAPEPDPVPEFEQVQPDEPGLPTSEIVGEAVPLEEIAPEAQDGTAESMPQISEVPDTGEVIMQEGYQSESGEGVPTFIESVANSSTESTSVRQ